MPSNCGVVGCKSRATPDQKGRVFFYRLPSVLHFEHKKHLNELSKRRREKWIQALNREDLTELKLKNIRICSKHFVTGRPSKLEDDLHPDWIPSLCMGYKSSKSLKSAVLNVQRHVRKEKRTKSKEINNFQNDVCQLHFKSQDLITTMNAIDERTGEMLSVPMYRYRLQPGAVPSIFPDNPAYYSKLKELKESKPKGVNIPLAHKEEIILEIVNDEHGNIEEEHKYNAKPVTTIVIENLDYVTTIDDLILKSSKIDHGPDWLKSCENNELRYFYIGNKLPVPRCAILILYDLRVTIEFEDIQIRSLQNMDSAIPPLIKNVNQITPILLKCNEFIKYNSNLTNQEVLRSQLIEFFTRI